VTEQPAAVPHGTPDGLWRWLLGGLAGGAAVLGLLIAAYAIGYHHGQDHPREATPESTATVAPTTTRARPPGSVQGTTPALVARGKSLFDADGCSACHSLTGGAGVGPSLNDIAGKEVTLSTGETITADDAYLEQSILDPDAHVVKGYRAGIMPAAIESFNLANKPDDIDALVAFMKSEK
jgi:cytochrome c2